MANQFTYCGALETLKAKLQWEDESLTEIEERFRLMGILYYATVTIRHFEDAIKRAEKSIIIRDLADVDFDYWTNINHWDLPGWLTNEDLAKAHLLTYWSLHNNREYISAKLANDITGLLPEAPSFIEHNDESAREGMSESLQLLQGVYFNSHQLRYALYQAIEALIQTIKNLHEVLYRERTEEEYATWYDNLRMEFTTKLISDISKRYASICNQRLTGPNREWLLERFGDAASTFWKTQYMQARKDACSNQECKNQNIFFNIPNLSKEQQRKFFHVLLEVGSFSENGYVIDKPAQAGKCIYLLYLSNIKEQAILDFFTFQITAQLISSDLSKFPEEKKNPEKKVKLTENDTITFQLGNITDGHLQLLRLKLMEVGWIAKDTQPDDFAKLFSGTTNHTKIVWTGCVGKGMLVFLFKEMEKHHYLIVPENNSINTILECHFVDETGRKLTGLHSSKPTKKFMPIIKQCLDQLQIEINLD